MTLSSEYELSEVIALSKAAQRFLMRYTQMRQRTLPRQDEVVGRQSPDTAGFRKQFGSHFKPTLE